MENANIHYDYAKFSVTKTRYEPVKEQLKKIADSSTENGGLEVMLFKDGTQISIKARQQRMGGTPMLVKYKTDFLSGNIARIIKGLNRIPSGALGRHYR
jgi:hypothetical protein